MPRLYLHIGHGKTGTSYIQSSLAASVAALQACGINYPPHPGLEKAAAGGISSGNGKLITKMMTDSSFNFEEHLLLSSEFLFDYLQEAQFCDALAAFISERPITCDIILFIRDPISYSCSAYQQAIKRSGYTGELLEYLKATNIPRLVTGVIDAIRRLPKTTLSVKNYSATAALLPVMENWLGLSAGTLRRPPIERVNRPLTGGELEFQRQLNLVVGRSGSMAADIFCTELPDLKVDLMRPSLAERERIWDELRSDIEAVNARVDAEARYDKERDMHGIPTPSEDVFRLSQEQLALIASCLGRQAKRAEHAEVRYRDLRAARKQQVDKLRSQLEILKQQVAALRGAKAGLATKLQTARERADALKQQAVDFKASNASHRTTLRDLRAQVEDLENKIASLKATPGAVPVKL